MHFLNFCYQPSLFENRNYEQKVFIYRLGGGTYGPTGVYFTADSNAQAILTQPPEVLVADEGEQDDLGHIQNFDEDSDHALNLKAGENDKEEEISDVSDGEEDIEFDSDKETEILKSSMVHAEDSSLNVIKDQNL